MKKKESNDNNSQSGEKLVERQPIPHTPFVAIRIEEGWFLTMGKFRMTGSIYESYEQLIESLERNKWEIIATLCGIICEYQINESKSNNNE